MRATTGSELLDVEDDISIPPEPTTFPRASSPNKGCLANSSKRRQSKPPRGPRDHAKKVTSYNNWSLVGLAKPLRLSSTQLQVVAGTAVLWRGHVLLRASSSTPSSTMSSTSSTTSSSPRRRDGANHHLQAKPASAGLHSSSSSRADALQRPPEPCGALAIRPKRAST